MQLFDRDRLAILILAGSCWLPTASAEKPAEGTGKGDGKGAPARLETFTAEQKAHSAYQPLKRPELPEVRKRTGLPDETLVVWGGEFGRTPIRQQGGRGRDHNATGFTMWMAGC